MRGRLHAAGQDGLGTKGSTHDAYECHHPWPCYGKPTVIFHDRGNIFTSQRATQVLVDRLGITTEQASPYAPSAKGTVEALFTWTTRKFEHRLSGTTKASTRDRGAYDSAGEAEKHARQACELAKVSDNTIIAVEALLCLGRIAYAQARYEEGGQHFVAGLEMLERLNMTEEFPEQSASYAHLLNEQGKPQEAITYYRLVIESRQKGKAY